MDFQMCVNCNRQAGYPHKAGCPMPKYFGEPDPGSPNAHRIEPPYLCDHCEPRIICGRWTHAPGCPMNSPNPKEARHHEPQRESEGDA